jgi:hypothetical protein
LRHLARQLFWVFGQLQIMLAVMGYVMAGGSNTFIKETLPLFYVASSKVSGDRLRIAFTTQTQTQTQT